MHEFGDVLALAPSELRALALEGDALGRLWAAWALGLALGANIVPFARDRSVHEPDAGVRRQLAVILAGYGEHAVVATLAADDPDPSVRGTAITCLFRVGDVEAARRAAFDPSVHVRETAMQLLGLAWPDERLCDAVDALDDTAPHDTALEILSARPLSPAVVQPLADRAASLRDPALWRLVVAADPRAALRHAGRHDHRAQLEVLAIIDRRHHWDDLGGLDRERIGSRLLDYVDLDSVPLLFLCAHGSADAFSALARQLDSRAPGDLGVDERAALENRFGSGFFGFGCDDGDDDLVDAGTDDEALIGALARHGIMRPWRRRALRVRPLPASHEGHRRSRGARRPPGTSVTPSRYGRASSPALSRR